MKKLIGIFLAGLGMLVVGIGIVFFFRDALTKGVLISAVKKITEVSLDVKKIHTAPFKGIIQIKGLQLMNPPKFPEKVLADIPELTIDIDISALLKRRVHIRELVLNLGELVILRNEQGELNLSSLKPIRQGDPSEDEPSVSQLSEKPKKMAFQLDHLRLSVGKAFYRDYRAGNPPPSREYKIGIKEVEYQNIQDPAELVRQIIGQALTRTAFSELGDLEGIQKKLERSLKNAKSSMKKGSQKVLEEAVETLNALQFLKNRPPE